MYRAVSAPGTHRPTAATGCGSVSALGVRVRASTVSLAACHGGEFPLDHAGGRLRRLPAMCASLYSVAAHLLPFDWKPPVLHPVLLSTACAQMGRGFNDRRCPPRAAALRPCAHACAAGGAAPPPAGGAARRPARGRAGARPGAARAGGQPPYLALSRNTLADRCCRTYSAQKHRAQERLEAVICIPLWHSVALEERERARLLPRPHRHSARPRKQQ